MTPTTQSSQNLIASPPPNGGVLLCANEIGRASILPPVGMLTARQERDASLRPAQLSPSCRPEQYDDECADFFDDFNRVTARPELYYGALSGWPFSETTKLVSGKHIAVDFGCGTGWLTKRLPSLGFSDVYGIDTSLPMLKKAFAQTPQSLISKGVIMFHETPPEEIFGKCDLVTAVHVHYHFEPFKNLQCDFFGKIADLLLPNGQMILIGCPSDHVADTPDHYQNCVHINDIPDNVKNKASNLDLLKDEEGFVRLACLPRYRLEDGTQMKVSLTAEMPTGKDRYITLKDTFWTDSTLIRAADNVGLKLIDHKNLTWRDHPNAYMLMRFKKEQHCTPNPHLTP